MKVAKLMTRDVHCCGPNDSLADAAELMWQHDCGCVPVVDNQNRVLGMITDRDICMATWSQGKPAQQLSIDVPMSTQVWACHDSDTVATAEQIMREKKVRRLPVLDSRHRLVGILSLNDIVREGAGSRLGRGVPELPDAEVRQTVAAVSQPRPR